jgi:phospholipase C
MAVTILAEVVAAKRPFKTTTGKVSFMKTSSSKRQRKQFRGATACILLTAALAAAPLFVRADPPQRNLDQKLREKIEHIIVIYQENWSFDSLYGQYPGADGLANGFDALPQRDKSTGYTTYIYQTPQPLNGTVDNRFPPANGLPALPLIPYDLTQFVANDQTTGDIIHRFYHEQLQIDNGVLEPVNGSLDKFVTWSDNPGLVLSYIDATNLPEGKLAQEYTLCDNFFHSAYGGSFLNHQFIVAAAAPRWNQPIPAGFQSSWDPTTRALSDGNLTIDGAYVVNTTYGAQAPHPTTAAAKLLLPINNTDPTKSDYMPTIGNRLDDAGVSWKWYSGGWNAAIANNADPLFQYHHQPFAYYAKYAPFKADGTLNPATTGPGAHLQDEVVFLSDVQHGTLPAVSFIKPLGPDNEHPGYASLLRGQQHVADLVNAVKASRFWKDTVIIVTYDENGGRWDHVTPPMVDSWGVGTRVPTIVISPFTRGGNVDGTQLETVSILKLIERRYHLAPLSARDANPAVNDLTQVFDFAHDKDDCR